MSNTKYFKATDGGAFLMQPNCTQEQYDLYTSTIYVEISREEYLANAYTYFEEE